MSDISITPSAVIPSTSADRRQIVFGATVTAGQTVFKNTTDGKYYLADGNDATKMPVEGMAIDGGSAAQPGFIVIKDPALAIGSHGAGIGIPLFQSATAGGVCPFADLASGNQTTCLGVTNDATHIYFNPTGGVGVHA